jgi:hypothetical protein
MKPDRARRIARELQLGRSQQMDVRFHGESMRPLLRDGDRVIVESVSWEQIRVGDLVTYRFEDKFPTRRVVRKRADSLLLFCDNWPELRWNVAREDVLGRATARERDGVRLGREDAEWSAAAARGLAIFHWSRARHAVRRLRALLRWP